MDNRNGEMWFSGKKNELLDTVQKVVKNDNIGTPFKDGKPGQTWYASVLKRHSKISVRTAVIVDKSRAKLTEGFIRAWFKDLQTFLAYIKATDILEDPARILNVDQSGILLCPKTGRLLGPKGWKNLIEVKHGNPKQNLTTLVTFTADGRICPSVVVFPYVKPPRSFVQSMPPNWSLRKTQFGWMRSEVVYLLKMDFVHYLRKHCIMKKMQQIAEKALQFLDCLLLIWIIQNVSRTD